MLAVKMKNEKGNKINLRGKIENKTKLTYQEMD